MRMQQPGREAGKPKRSELKPKRGEPEEENRKKEKKRSNKEKVARGDKKDGRQQRETSLSKELRAASGPTRRLSPGSGSHDRLGEPLPLGPGPRGAGVNVGNAADGMKAVGISGKKKKGKAEKNHLGWYWWLKLVLTIIFVAGYSVGVFYLFGELVKAKAYAEKDEDSAACKRLQCPGDSVCVDHSGTGRAMCSENSYQNLQILQIVLGIVVGIPAVICLPCSLQWLVRTGGPWLCSRYVEKKRQLRVSSVKNMQKSQSREVSTDSPRDDDDLEPGQISARSSRARRGFCGCWRRKPEAAPHPERPVIIAAAVDSEVPMVDDGDRDDMAEFFASTPTAVKKDKEVKAEAPKDDFLDLIFASKRNVENAPPPLPGGDDDGIEPEEDIRGGDGGMDMFFASVKTAAPEKPRRAQKDVCPDEESLDDFFHRPPRRAPEQPKRNSGPGRAGAALPPMPTSVPARQRVEGEGDARSNFSLGLSAIFASVQKGPAARSIRSGSAISRISKASSKSSVPQDDGDEEYDDEEEEEDWGEAPDFIGFALGIARKLNGNDDNESKSGIQDSDIFNTDPHAGGRDWDERSDASGASGVDSLAGLEAASFSELFHPPLD